MTALDKSFWKSVVDTEFAVPEGHTADELLPHLLDLLASTDPELRDDYAYMILLNWIVRDPKYTSEQLREVKNRLVNGMRVGIGENGTDTIFQRTFSILALGLVVYRDNDAPYLEATEIKALLDAALDYIKDEKDPRGYVEGSGWAHGLAHDADLLRFLARNRHIDAGDLLRILTTISDKLTEETRIIYLHDEDERLVLAVAEVLQRDLLNETVLKGWLDGFYEWHEKNIGGAFVVTIHATYQNIKHFVRSLFFRLERMENLPATAETFKAEVLSAAKRFSM